MNLTEMLLGSMTSESSVSHLAKKSGGSSSQITKLLIAAIPVIIMYLTKNASSKQGATSLLSALGQHKNTNALTSQIASADAVDGSKIIKHIFGSDEESTISSLAQQTGMSSSQVSDVLSNIAPSVMSGLSAATTSTAKKSSGFDLSDGLDMGDLVSLIGGGSSSKSSGFDLSDGFGLDDVVGLIGGGQKKKSAFDGSDLIGMLSGLMK